MEKYLCTHKFVTKTGFTFFDGRVYEVGNQYWHYMEVQHLNGLRCYVEIDMFRRSFVKYDVDLVAVDKMFNIIMDGI